MIINRKLAPTIKPIKQVNLLDSEVSTLKNGIRLVQLHGGLQEVISLQLVFPAGRWQEKKHLQAFFTASQLIEGTKNKTSQQVSEIIDFHGAELSISSSYDFAGLSLICLTKHIGPMLELIIDILNNPLFDEKELAIKKQILKQRLQVNLQKTDYVAQRKFHELNFGENHPYGYQSTADLYDLITAEDLFEHYHNCYTGDQPFAVLAGQYSNNDQQLIAEQLARLPTSLSAKTNEYSSTSSVGSFYQPFELANQTSIRLGCSTIDSNHVDYHKLKLMNCVLGGYFGSRLMTNLREEKGLTYGVYSQLGSFVNQGYLFVGTDVGKEHRQLAITEIKTEIEKMQQTKLSTDELELVRNYLMGKFLSAIDGPFEQARLYRSLLIKNQTANDFNQGIESILATTVDDIQTMAQQYFQLDKMVEVMVG